MEQRKGNKMKTVMDYLKEHKRYEHDAMGRNFILELREGDVFLKLNEEEWLVDGENGQEIEVCIQDILEENKIEIRFCEICGKPFDYGYTVDGGFWYCCEDCFEPTMDNDYGKGNWRGTDEEGDNGGFYEYLSDGEWEDTGVYWTEWY